MSGNTALATENNNNNNNNNNNDDDDADDNNNGTVTCPICYDETVENGLLYALEACQHRACRACFRKWFSIEEKTGQSQPTCPMDHCRALVGHADSLLILGRSFVPAGSLHQQHQRKKQKVAASNEELSSTSTTTTAVAGKAKDNQETLSGDNTANPEDDNDNADDKLSTSWLEQHAIRCGGCDTWITKLDGCDKVQCICGFRICWKCKAVGGRCSHNAGHGFINNITGRAEFFGTQQLPKEHLADHVKAVRQSAAASAAARRGQRRSMLFMGGTLPTPTSTSGHYHHLHHPAAATAASPYFGYSMGQLLPHSINNSMVNYPGLATPGFHTNNNHNPYSPGSYNSFVEHTRLQRMLDRQKRQSSSLQRRDKLIQRLIQDDVSTAFDLYNAELESNHGQPPVWVDAMKPYLRHMEPDDVASLFPGVAAATLPLPPPSTLLPPQPQPPQHHGNNNNNSDNNNNDDNDIPRTSAVAASGNSGSISPLRLR